MLRLAVIALLLANAGYYAYTQGWLRSAGLVTPEQAEPQRLQQQIRPETLKVLRAQGATNNPTPPPAPAAAPAADTAASTLPHGSRPGRCGRMPASGRFDDKQAAALRTAAAALPPAAGAWSPRPSPGAG